MASLGKVRIQPVLESADIDQIEELAKRIWTDHYTPIIGEEQVHYMLQNFQSAKAIAKQISEGYEYYLIMLDENSLGYLSILSKDDSLFLSKLYVESNQRGKGLGKAGMEFVYQRARELGLDNVWLTVNKNNSIAIKAYEKLGFVKTEELVIDIGQGFVMDDYKMVKQF